MEVTGDPPDYVSTMIIAAIVAVSGERLRRIGIESDYEALANELPAQALGKCNLTSISIATGLNRETVRRKVQRLEAQGILVKDGATRVRLSHDFVRSDTVIEMIQTQIETVQKTVSQLARDRVLVSPNDQA